MSCTTEVQGFETGNEVVGVLVLEMSRGAAILLLFSIRREKKEEKRNKEALPVGLIHERFSHTLIHLVQHSFLTNLEQARTFEQHPHVGVRIRAQKQCGRYVSSDV